MERMAPLYLPGCPPSPGTAIGTEWSGQGSCLPSARTELPALPLWHGEAGLGIAWGQVSNSVYLFKGHRSCN